MESKDKRAVIEKLVILPKKNKRIFWAKEIKCFNEVFKLYPDSSFWKRLTFPDKFESINFLRSGYYGEELKKKYSRYVYKIPEAKTITLAEKSGQDIETRPQKRTIREFLT